MENIFSIFNSPAKVLGLVLAVLLLIGNVLYNPNADVLSVIIGIWAAITWEMIGGNKD